MSSPARMTFRRYGRSLHLRIATAEDLRHVLDLDEAHWVATGAPIPTINADPVFLSLLDTDRNGRIMCFEVKDAISWLFVHMRDASDAMAASTTLRLAAVNADTPTGAGIVASARKILARLGAADAEAVSLEQVRKIKAEVEKTPVSEAGVVLPAAATDAEVGAFLTDVIATVGGAPHPGGEQGVGEAQLQRFLSDARAHLAWRQLGQVPDDQAATKIMPLGPATPVAYAVFAALRDKVDQYFAQCEAVSFDERAGERAGLKGLDLESTDFADPGSIRQALKAAPLATPRVERTLALTGPVNPEYADRLARLRNEVVEPLLERSVETLSEAEWNAVKARLAAHDDWVNSEPGRAVAPLGADKLTTYLEPRFASAVRELIAASGETAFVLDNIRLTEKLILYQAFLMRLTNNFVSFPDLYDPERTALFDMGRLVMDGREFNLSVRVTDRAAHAGMAKTSNMYVMYVEILSKEGEKIYEVAVPVTSGGKGNLCVGKRGIFEDVHGREWDARVAQIIENPISIAEAMIAPFQRIGRVITGKIESITTEAEKKLDSATAGVVTNVAGPAQPAPAPTGRGLMAGGLLMGGGVAIAALGSAVAYITKTLGGMEYWKILIGLSAAVLAVILPTTLVALIKLRRRDLSAILEGSGWAINARMRLSRRLSRYFTRKPSYPHRARGVHRVWPWVVAIVIILLLAGGGGLLVRGCARRRSVQAPAPTTPTAPTTQTATTMQTSTE